jgi:hypothetical protein
MNDGRGFQKLLQTVVEAYEVRGVATLRKTDPPVRVLHQPGGRQKVIFLSNPFLDYIGTWTARGGQTIVIECKSTREPVLRLVEDEKVGAGIKRKQLNAALAWQRGGAAVAFLWEYNGAVRIVSPAMVEARWLDRKSLLWADAHKVPQGEGFILFDFLACLAALTKRAAGDTLADEKDSAHGFPVSPRGDPLCQSDGRKAGDSDEDHSTPGQAGNAPDDRTLAESESRQTG